MVDTLIQDSPRLTCRLENGGEGRPDGATGYKTPGPLMNPGDTATLPP